MYIYVYFVPNNIILTDTSRKFSKKFPDFTTKSGIYLQKELKY